MIVLHPLSTDDPRQGKKERLRHSTFDASTTMKNCRADLDETMTKSFLPTIPIDYIVKPSFLFQTSEVALASSLICVVSPFDLKIGNNATVPISLQSLIILLVPAVLGKTRGCLSVLLYLFSGSILELPVFAKGASGKEKLYGPSGGFLWAFLVSTFWVGWYHESYHLSVTFESWLACFLAGHVIILTLGFIWLGLYESSNTSFSGLLHDLLMPLMPGLCFKCITGAFIATACNNLLLKLVPEDAR
jgi:biotin transport system substrate-specific component